MRLLLVYLTFAAATHAENLLVTNVGKHALEGSGFSLELSLPEPTQLYFTVEWQTELSPNEEGLPRLLKCRRAVGPAPVTPGQWAFCFVGSDELWCSAGPERFIRWKGTNDDIATSDTCNDPELGKAAPEELKQRNAKKLPNESVQAAQQLRHER